MKTNRSISSFYNVISAVALTLVNGLLGIVVTRLVIMHYGSDFNGLNATANQIVNVLLVLEGGFTLASNVALFAPVSAGDYPLVNGILTATRKKFRTIGVVFLCAGMVAAAAYTMAVNSGLPKAFIAAVVLMAVVPQAFNLYYATTYRVFLQAQQKEYIVSMITILTVGAGHIANIILILAGGPMWLVRFITMMAALLNSLLIKAYVKHRFQYIRIGTDTGNGKGMIKGTNDVLVQKVTGVVYESAPIVFLSISPAGGTLAASVYAVYNNVFIMVKSLLHGMIDAPRMGIGQMLAERPREDVWKVFRQYEYAAACAVFILLATAYVLILPFIKIYTAGVDDIGYYDAQIAMLMAVTAAIEMLHIPSGHLINMAGEFKISRNFQAIACALLLGAMYAGKNTAGVYGMLAALLLTAVVLAVLEMGYVHMKFFEKKLPELCRVVAPFAVLGVAICAVERRIPVRINGYFDFFLFGAVFLCIHTAAACMISLIFHRTLAISLFSRAKNIFRKRKG